ncbi:hypothetical protein AB6A40_000606 [Gnathostoma spinigerum]|uniref:TIL domain-containing protein n=1 Tax=Gnathostoma spinigerum TaxID=75299 RepID=A0ABD6EBN5_9BILA
MNIPRNRKICEWVQFVDMCSRLSLLSLLMMISSVCPFCTPCDPATEFYDPCASPCPRLTCENPTPTQCDLKQCIARCECRPHYVHHLGKCIPRSECPKS